jgi:hypothetical protein
MTMKAIQHLLMTSRREMPRVRMLHRQDGV